MDFGRGSAKFLSLFSLLRAYQQTATMDKSHLLGVGLSKSNGEKISHKLCRTWLLHFMFECLQICVHHTEPKIHLLLSGDDKTRAERFKSHCGVSTKTPCNIAYDMYEEKQREVDMFILESTWLKQETIAFFQYTENSSELFSVISWYRTLNNEFKLREHGF